jgi:predicted esterase
VEHPGTALMSAYPDSSYEGYEGATSLSEMGYQAENEVTTPIIDEQTQDIRFALAQMKKIGSEGSDSPVASKIDFSKLGIIGHSQGGATAVNVLYEDADFKAAIDLDGYLYSKDRPSAPLDMDEARQFAHGRFRIEVMIFYKRKEPLLPQGYLGLSRGSLVFNIDRCCQNFTYNNNRI